MPLEMGMYVVWLSPDGCGGFTGTVLPSLTQLACDTRKSVFSHAHTPMDKNLTRTGKNIPNSDKTYIF